MAPIALIVEDDDGLRLIYNHILKDLGFQVLEAEDGQIALDILGETTPQIMFLDMRLPFVNGMQILDFMAEEPRFANTRVVVASSNHPQRDIPADSQVEFVLKPIRPAQIRDLARSVL